MMPETLDLPNDVTLDRRPLPLIIPDGKIGLVLRIESAYELYSDVTVYGSVVVTPPPPEGGNSYSDWTMDEIIYPYTGVGRPEGDSWYDIEVLESTHPDLIPVGKTWDWGY